MSEAGAAAKNLGGREGLPSTEASGKAPVTLPSEASEDADVRLFPAEGSAEGCASGECLPETPAEVAVPVVASGPSLVSRDDATRSLLDRWRAVIDTVKFESPRHAASLSHAHLLWIRPGQVGVWYRPEAGFHRTSVSAASGKASVDKLLSLHFGVTTRLVIEGKAEDRAAPAGSTVAQLDAQNKADREKTADNSVRAHPALRAIFRHLGGELEHVSFVEPDTRPTAEPEPPDELA